ncbi:hypothetical protein CNBG_0543 [Cryptococcus deuterogattii R265]|uniref:Outer spore wall protein RRT8 n=1 Tax=Cryptococcus deuterogattii (strain R265) TaxID=294750 RepID=A0A095C163_CRYD2|nr:hypothetical protein CNBG_0543 [Cryptococcus deuterogattii R265]KIR29636.1 hypothetical protein I309_01120 [Cryptococcus deuterogattii LA55]KIR75863.1 hypothetical protein I310_00561 [Cryptococcus deuterogattii CA1014]KIR95806.1 hypothetical protein I304_00562 [Cryptococcus deuterogattii CBS 10090]
MSSSQTRKRSQRLKLTSETVTESARRQVQEVGAIAQDGLSSGAWIYPLLGILYLFSHPTLIRPLLPVIIKGILMSAGVVTALFAFAYLPQVAVLAVISGPLAFALAIPLILGEAFVVVMFLTRGILVAQATVDIFDAVLLQKGHSALVENGRQITNKGGKVKQLGTMMTKPLSRFNVDSVVRYLLTLPLNFIPLVGTIFFLGYNGYKAGPGFHARYFQLKNFDKDRRQAFIKKRRGAYLMFGTMAMALNLIPIVSIVFSFTTATGAALWASELENMGKTPTAVPQTDANATGKQEEVEVQLPQPAVNDKKKEL